MNFVSVLSKEFSSKKSVWWYLYPSCKLKWHLKAANHDYFMYINKSGWCLKSILTRLLFVYPAIKNAYMSHFELYKTEVTNSHIWKASVWHFSLINDLNNISLYQNSCCRPLINNINKSTYCFNLLLTVYYDKRLYYPLLVTVEPQLTNIIIIYHQF